MTVINADCPWSTGHVLAKSETQSIVYQEKHYLIYCFCACSKNLRSKRSLFHLCFLLLFFLDEAQLVAKTERWEAGWVIVHTTQHVRSHCEVVRMCATQRGEKCERSTSVLLTKKCFSKLNCLNNHICSTLLSMTQNVLNITWRKPSLKLTLQCIPYFPVRLKTEAVGLDCWLGG